MEKYFDSEIHHVGKSTGDYRTKEVLAYKLEFKNELKQSKSVLAEAKKTLEEMMGEIMTGKDEMKKELVRETPNLQIIYLGKKLRSSRFYFGVKNKNTDLDYFVKISIDNGILMSGPQELVITEQLKKDLANIKGVRVASGLFGFHEAGKTYYVSRFDGSLVGSSREKFIQIARKDNDKYKELVKRHASLVRFLKSADAHALNRKYGDVDNNIAYDEDKDEFVVYDLLMYDGDTDNGLVKK